MKNRRTKSKLIKTFIKIIKKVYIDSAVDT